MVLSCMALRRRRYVCFKEIVKSRRAGIHQIGTKCKLPGPANRGNLPCLVRQLVCVPCVGDGLAGLMLVRNGGRCFLRTCTLA